MNLIGLKMGSNNSMKWMQFSLLISKLIKKVFFQVATTHHLARNWLPKRRSSAISNFTKDYSKISNQLLILLGMAIPLKSKTKPCLRILLNKKTQGSFSSLQFINSYQRIMLSRWWKLKPSIQYLSSFAYS